MTLTLNDIMNYWAAGKFDEAYREINADKWSYRTPATEHTTLFYLNEKTFIRAVFHQQLQTVNWLTEIYQEHSGCKNVGASFQGNMYTKWY